MTYLDTQLEDKFDLSKTRVYTSGAQALVRLCLMQAARDRAAGLDTGGYISGSNILYNIAQATYTK